MGPEGLAHSTIWIGLIVMAFFKDMSDNPFLALGLIAGLLASVSCGVMGPYVIARRIVFLSGAIAHMAVGGIGAAVFLNGVYPETFGWLHPLHGAVVSALAAAILIGLLHERVAEVVSLQTGVAHVARIGEVLDGRLGVRKVDAHIAHMGGLLSEHDLTPRGDQRVIRVVGRSLDDIHERDGVIAPTGTEQHHRETAGGDVSRRARLARVIGHRYE